MKFGLNTGNTQGILFPQVVNSLTLKYRIFPSLFLHMKLSQISEIVTGKIP